MFILYAIAIGLVLGSLAGGRLVALGSIPIRWAPLILLGFLAQIVLFSDVVAERVGAAGPLLYVVSTLMVGAAVVRNLRIPGMPLIVLGAASNMAAILANNGFMPAAPEALASLGKSAPTIYSNSAVVAQPALEFLTDRFALPRWLPFANVFSVGDVLIGVGVVILIVVSMSRARSDGALDGPMGPRIDPRAAPGAGMH
jgi:uncharacterized protein DUF5317